MNSFLLKIIAISAMFIDHLRYILPGKPIFMSYIGRLAFPIFAFQIVEGYHHTKSLKKYFIKLGSFAIIAQLPFMLFTDSFKLNILFTFILGLAILFIYDKVKGDILNNIIRFSSIFLLIAIAELAKVDYGAYGLIVILLFHVFRGQNLKLAFTFIVSTILYFTIKYNIADYRIITFAICTCLAVVPILLYNGNLGSKKFRHLFYWFYPAHLLVLYLIGLNLG